MYRMGEQRMIETRNHVAEMNKIIKNLTTVYDKIAHILEKLICSCYLDDV